MSELSSTMFHKAFRAAIEYRVWSETHTVISNSWLIVTKDQLMAHIAAHPWWHEIADRERHLAGSLFLCKLKGQLFKAVLLFSSVSTFHMEV